MASPAPVADDELVRRARELFDQQRLERRSRRTFLAVAVAVVVGAVGSAMLVRGSASLSLVTTIVFVVTYAVVASVKFEIGPGAAIPTQLVLVPMLFAVPPGAVPAVVATALVVNTAVTRRAGLRPERLIPPLVGAAHALGPAVVIGLAAAAAPRWGAWPIYVGALAAQFGCDFAANAVVARRAHRLQLRVVANVAVWAYLVDAALAPIGLAIAFATRSHTWLVVLVLPLVALLRHFAQERQRRIDHALELSDAYRGTAFLLGDVVEADHAYTGSHSRHVVDLVLSVCDKLGLDAADRRDAEFTALLHDVGKIRIPQEIIDKPGKLDAEERRIIETHTIEGEQMLERVGGLLGHVGRLVRSCHEHWDGGGYPDALMGDQIPLVARIVCACDAFSAMTTDRSYRSAMTHDEAVTEMERCAGTQFDPRVVAALVASV